MWKNGKPDGNGVFTENGDNYTVDFLGTKMVMENTLGKMVILMMGIGMKIKWMEEESITGQEKVLHSMGYLKKVTLPILK